MTMQLETKQLAKSYGQGDAYVQALHPTDLSIRKNESVAIVGASGSGKSTLLHLLGGLDLPSAGTVLVDGVDLYVLPESERAKFRRQQFGFVFQAFHLIPILTAEENIVMPLLLDGRRPDRDEVRTLCEKLGIVDRLHHLPGQLSGGQQQRVAIARALAAKPQMIFADEPTGNLDSKSSKEVMDLLAQTVRDHAQTLVVITHDEKVAEQLGRTIHITDGWVTEAGDLH